MWPSILPLFNHLAYLPGLQCGGAVGSVITSPTDSPDDGGSSYVLVYGPEGPGSSIFESTGATAEFGINNVPETLDSEPLFLNIRYKIG